MKIKVLIKTKIELSADKTTLTIFMWKPFLLFGYWYPFGVYQSSVELDDDKIKNINDNEVSKLLFNNLLK